MNTGPEPERFNVDTRQIIQIRDIPQSPIRSYARDAIAAHRDDQRRGVLAYRIATYLAAQFLDTPHVSLDSLPAGSTEFYLGLAQTSLALMDSINDVPPTPGEIARHEQRKALASARARVRCQANANRHELGLWRVDFDRPGTETVTCTQCWAGASLHGDVAKESLSDGLLRECPGKGWR